MTSTSSILASALSARPLTLGLGRQRWLSGLLFPLLLIIAPAAYSADFAVSVSAVDPDAPAELSRLADKAPARIRGIPIDRPGRPSVDLDLRKFNVFTPDAKVVIRDAHGERVETVPAMSHFKGEIEGRPGSVAFWSVAADGRMRGILHLDGDIFVTETPAAGSASTATARSRKADTSLDARDRTFTCDVEDWHDPVSAPAVPRRPSTIVPQEDVVAALTTAPYAVRVAVDTDFEFYQLFNDPAKATGYIADLFAYMSMMYSSELQATLQISDLYLYATANDPWNAMTSGAGLDELKNYWTANRTSVSRAIVHQVSGKPFLSGNAYLDVLCDNNFGYGFTAGLSGEFSPNNPQLIWDAAGVAHEIGHNFSSPHTHCYAGIGGNASAIDRCSNSETTCYSGATALPGVGSLSGGTPGTGTGTIMSYCQLLTPGLSNVTMTLGLNHVYGVAAGRVPTRMRTALEAAVARAPACFTSTNAILLVDKVGGGVVTSSPPGIDCGNDCSQTYPSPASVTLTATPVPGYVFGSWSGDCTGAGNCVVSVNGMRRVTANFNLDPTYDDAFPPNGTIPNGWGQAAGSSAPWAVATDSRYFGPHSLKSGVIANGQTSGISYTGEFTAGVIRFARRVSSEPSFDFFRFYIDGVQQAEWSGDVAWDVVSFPVTAGVHIVRWRYEKDDICCSEGSDAGWIDYVSLPTVAVGMMAPVLQSAASRKIHGGAGAFDLPLSLMPTFPSTEPRQGPAQTIVFTFDKAIAGATVAVTEGTATALAPTFSGNAVIVGLTGVTNQQYVTIAVTDVSSVDGGTGGSGTVRVGFLLGDVSQNRVVTLADLGQVNAQIAQSVTATNYLRDVNASGTLSLADKGIANTQLTKALPTP